MFADQLVERFVASGIMQHEYDHVKLHITVMNSLMRKDLSHAVSSQGGQTSTRSGTRDRESFDAVQLMQVVYVDSVELTSICACSHLLCNICLCNLWFCAIF